MKNQLKDRQLRFDSFIVDGKTTKDRQKWIQLRLINCKVHVWMSFVDLKNHSQNSKRFFSSSFDDNDAFRGSFIKRQWTGGIADYYDLKVVNFLLLLLIAVVNFEF